MMPENSEPDSSAFVHEVLVVDAYAVHIYSDDKRSKQQLTEAKHRGVPLVGIYSFHKHAKQTGIGDEHLHLYAKNNQIFAINKDGTAHDDSHGVHIPNKVMTALKARFPGWNFPQDNIIENCDRTKVTMLLLESEAG